jgi:hypothetical protein
MPSTTLWHSPRSSFVLSTFLLGSFALAPACNSDNAPGGDAGHLDATADALLDSPTTPPSDGGGHLDTGLSDASHPNASDAGPDASDAAAQDALSGQDVVTLDSPASSDGAPDSAASDANVTDAVSSCSTTLTDAGTCNSLTQLGGIVTPTCATGTEPTGTGGTPVDGTYNLTALTFYDCADAAPPMGGWATFVLSGDCFEGVYELGGNPVATETHVIGPDGGSTMQCNTNGAGHAPPTETFTATGFTLYYSGFALVFTKM